MKALFRAVLIIAAGSLVLWSTTYGLAAEKLLPGKKSTPGSLSPGTRSEMDKTKPIFSIPRDPFKRPTEVIPTDCPPSAPLVGFHIVLSDFGDFLQNK